MIEQHKTEQWDEQHASGKWDFLRNVNEVARYGILAAWLQRCNALQAVLDAGCGEALLYHHLKPFGLGCYTGIDVSKSALTKAKVDPDHGKLVTADLEHFDVGSMPQYSGIVFNEVLYFCEQPEKILQNYAMVLKQNGVIAISMYAPERPGSGANRSIRRVWEETDDAHQWQVLDDIDLRSDAKNVRWKMRLVQPKRYLT